MCEGIRKCLCVGKDYLFDDLPPRDPPEVDTSLDEAPILLCVIARRHAGRPRPTLNQCFVDDEAEVRQSTEQLVAQPFANRIGTSYVSR